MLNVGEISKTKQELIKSKWFKKEFRPLIRKHLKDYRFLGAWVDGDWYDFKFDTPKDDELNIEVDKTTGDITHVTMNGKTNLVSESDLKRGHVTDLEEVIITFKSHIERATQRAVISKADMKKLLKEEASEPLEEIQAILDLIEEHQDNLEEVFVVENGKVKLNSDGLPILKTKKRYNKRYKSIRVLHE